MVLRTNRWPITVIAVLASFFGARQLVMRAEVPITAFSLQQDVSLAQPGEALQVSKHRTIARRSDGVTVILETVGHIEDAITTRHIVAPSAVVSLDVTLYDNLKMKTTWPVAPHGSDGERLSRDLALAGRNCARRGGPDIMVGADNLLGQAVITSQMTTGKNIVTAWARRRWRVRSCMRKRKKSFQMVPAVWCTRTRRSHSHLASLIRVCSSSTLTMSRRARRSPGTVWCR